MCALRKMAVTQPKPMASRRRNKEITRKNNDNDNNNNNISTPNGNY